MDRGNILDYMKRNVIVFHVLALDIQAFYTPMLTIHSGDESLRFPFEYCEWPRPAARPEQNQSQIEWIVSLTYMDWKSHRKYYMCISASCLRPQIVVSSEIGNYIHYFASRMLSRMF